MFGCAGLVVTAQERALFRAANPFGFILFKRNCQSPDQVRDLITELKQAVGRNDIAIAIDQEGGRVSRLQPPHWPKFPAARVFGQIYERDADWAIEAIKAYTRTVAHALTKMGITINCAPVLDLYNPAGTPALGDRAFSADAVTVAALARAQAETYLANGILPVMKHIPGHGRLQVDPHHVLPTINASLAELEAQDFVPFKLLIDLPLAMNSHAVFMALDPALPASLSPYINTDVIRSSLGFDGLLLSDDITMKALHGTADARARQAVAAGNDIVLHCSGDSDEMTAIHQALEPMNDCSWARWQHAQAMVAPINPTYDPTEDNARLDILLGGFEV